MHIVFLGALLLLGALVWFAAPHRIYRWAMDTFILFDGGWRIFNGQRPYVDFYSGLGPLTFQLVALGMFLGKPAAAAVDHGFAIAAVLLGLWTWRIARSRLEKPAGFLLALSGAAMVVAPHTLGGSPFNLTYAGLYNRLGYALVIIVLVEAVGCPLLPRRKADLWGGISTGVAASLSLFLKPTYFLVALTMAGGSFIFRDRRGKARAAGLGIGFVIPTILMLAYLRFDLGAVWQDMRTTALARLQVNTGTAADISNRTAGSYAYHNFDQFFFLGFLGLLVCLLPRRVRANRCLDSWWPLAAAAGIYAIDVAFMTTNGIQFSMPLVGCFALLLVGEMHAWWDQAGEQDRSRYRVMCALILILGLGLFLPEPLKDASAVIYSSSQSLAGKPIPHRFESASLGDLLTRETPLGWDEPDNGKVLVDRVNEGIRLLQEKSSPSETVFVLDFVNPFSFALLRRPAAGGTPLFGGGALNLRDLPFLDRMFSQADIIMVRNNPRLDSDAASMAWQFGGYVQKSFRLVAESPSWYLYRRAGR
jgi:hypothetical protein